MAKLNWTRFPDIKRFSTILDSSLPWTSRSEFETDPRGSGGITPFQFTLPVMFGLYASLQDHLFSQDGKSEQPISRYFGNGSPDGPPEFFHRDNWERIQHPPKLSKTSFDSCPPLRAIAYFSWEAERRCFLARRVYPTGFDFLSYSYVPEGWGALGIALKQIMERRPGHLDRPYTRIPDVSARKTLIPYLREAKRLRYNSILVLPVFMPTMRDPAHLLGAFAFYVKTRTDLPRSQVFLTARLKAFADQMGQKIMVHNEIVAGDDKSLFSLLQESYPVPSKKGGKDSVCELTIDMEPHGDPIELEKAVNAMLLALSGTKYVSVMEDGPASPYVRKILVVSLDSADDALEDNISKLMGLALKGKRSISHDVNFFRRKTVRAK